MSSSAVAACMAPLLLRPLLAGQCEFDDDFDMNVLNALAVLPQESLLGPEWSHIKEQVFDAQNRIRPTRKRFLESIRWSSSKGSEPSARSVSMPSNARVSRGLDFHRHTSAAESTLLEPTTRLDFFKERRSQLMEQLNTLDLNYGLATPEDYLCRSPPPSWT